MRNALDKALPPLTLLASASGARTWAGVAALEPRTIVPALALGELMLDKLPSMPDRNRGPSLLGRVAAGAVIGAIVARRRRADPVALAVVGALTSLASAHATYRLRRALMQYLPAFGAAVVEDVTVITMATAGAVLMERGTNA